MKKFLNLFKSNFFKNVATLASGTILAQLIGFAFLPVLSRVYPQAAFGIFASFTAMVSLLSSFVTLKYDTALVLPKEDKAAYSLLKLSNIITVIITVLCLGVLYLPIPYFKEYQGLQLLIAVGTILSVNYNNSALWNIRFKEFKTTAFSKVLQTVAIFLFQYMLYFYFDYKGLVIGNILGVTISGIYLITFRKFDWQIYKNISRSEMIEQGKRYIDFPKYFTLSNVILNLSSNLPVLLFVKYITLAQLGIYGLSVSIITQPVTLIAGSIKSVILAYLAEKKNAELPILSWYLKMIMFLLIMALIISGLILLVGTQIIEVFLGDKWTEVGVYLKMLIPLFIGLMISTPGTVAVRVFEMQKYSLIYSIISLIIRLGSLLLLLYFDVEFAYLILIYSFVNLLLIILNNVTIITYIMKYEFSLKKN